MLNFDDYRKDLKTIDLHKASRASAIITLGVAVLSGVAFYLLWRPDAFLTWVDSLLLVVLFVVGIVVHELIHGFFFGLFGTKGFKSIRFGVMWKMLTPYCHCNEPLKIKHYALAALMPALLLGIVPVVISLCNGSILMWLFGVIFTGAAAGDFMVVWVLRKEHRDTYVQDHPSEPGCFVFRKDDEN